MTTILALKTRNRGLMAGDGLVLSQNVILKQNLKKVRKIYHDKVLVGMTGNAITANYMLEYLDDRLEEKKGDVLKAAVQAMYDLKHDRARDSVEKVQLLVVSRDALVTMIGSGFQVEVLGDDDYDNGNPDYVYSYAMGSGGDFALGAARALLDNTDMDLETVMENSLKIAAIYCTTVNDRITVDEAK